jgi:hypothetical protein
MNKKIELNVNDYLDLYLLAKDLGDTIWQLEIIEQLDALTTGRPIKNQPLDKDILWKKYKLINEEIYQLYQHIKKHSTNHEIQEKMGNLKQERIGLGRQLGLSKRNTLKN